MTAAGHHRERARKYDKAGRRNARAALAHLLHEFDDFTTRYLHLERQDG